MYWSNNKYVLYCTFFAGVLSLTKDASVTKTVKLKQTVM